MKLSLLSRHLDIKRTQSEEVLGIILFKPEWSPNDVESFNEYCSKNDINILEKRNIILSKDVVIALYKNIFSFSTDDLRFGITWKTETIEYLTSGQSICFLVQGKCANEKLSKYKYTLRDKCGKITHPKNLMNQEDFKEKVIKNLVHVVDDDEIQNALWLIFY